ncbi:hypothetical protein [Microbacterium sp. SD291]|uniref:hypothetical protein n=1 Tax=Microbacterium sp. SD291 TaxID=2782007 RepID=UPI001A978AA7|nr:hypothetical protein [Microbacterium sp. SD291]MBO0979218.1 hypothetical protein [Microbacterium sp. SD291]
MTPSRTPTKLLTALGALILSAGALAGCTPEPAATPTPTAAFASEDEAFAAAEEVYRAYNDAVNLERRSDSSADPHDYLIGAALEGSLETTNKLKQEGLRITGDSAVLSFSGDVAEVMIDAVTIRASICLDVSSTQILDESGADLTPQSRADHVPLNVVFSGADSELLISESNLDEDAAC